MNGRSRTLLIWTSTRAGARSRATNGSAAKLCIQDTKPEVSLLNRMKERPFSPTLFDEIEVEKAHPRVMDKVPAGLGTMGTT